MVDIVTGLPAPALRSREIIELWANYVALQLSRAASVIFSLLRASMNIDEVRARTRQSLGIPNGRRRLRRCMRALDGIGTPESLNCRLCLTAHRAVREFCEVSDLLSNALIAESGVTTLHLEDGRDDLLGRSLRAWLAPGSGGGEQAAIFSIDQRFVESR